MFWIFTDSVRRYTEIQLTILFGELYFNKVADEVEQGLIHDDLPPPSLCSRTLYEGLIPLQCPPSYQTEKRTEVPAIPRRS